jgi:GNAT superfamily N-acetyltransferase
MAISYEWRSEFGNSEVNALHAAAFGTRVFTDDEWNWRELVGRHSLGWVTAREGEDLVGFVNVLWDGLVHAWVQDVMVAPAAGRAGVGTELVSRAKAGARDAGCEWLHVDFDDHLRAFYVDACGFTPATAGLIRLQSGGEGAYSTAADANNVSAAARSPSTVIASRLIRP